MDSAQYLAQLVGIDTTSSEKLERDRSNHQLIALMEQHFSACGFKTTTYEIAPGKFNLLALSPNAHGPDLGLLLCGHSDCVPFVAANWSSDPLLLREQAGKLYGRGTCDMKGFLACMMELAAQTKESKCYPKVSFLVTCDEETSMQGAIALPQLFAQDFPHQHFSLIIIGEPTSMQAVVAHKGYMARELTFKGVSAHSSHPDLGLNAIYSSNIALTKLQELERKLRQDFYDDGFAVPFPTLNIGYITGGHSLNSICDEVKLGFDLRPTPNMSPALALQLINECYESIVAACQDLHAQKKHNCALQAKLASKSLCTMNEPFADIPAFVNHDEHSYQLLNKHLGSQMSPLQVNYCTEASFLQELGPTVVLGPGSIDQAHGIDEYIERAQLELCMRFLRSLCTDF